MREQKQYEIVLHVGSLNLTTVLEVVKDSATVVNVKQLTTTAAKTPRTATRVKGTTTADTCLEALSDGKIHTDEDLAAVLHAKGFSASSVHPAVSALVRDGKAKRIARGRYCLATVTHIAR